MGKARKPLEMQSKHVTSIEKAKRRQEEAVIVVGAEQLRQPPVWLTDQGAIKEWYRLVKELAKIDIIGNLDKNNLACYCYAYVKWIETTKELEGADLIYYVTDTNGNTVPKENPLINIQRKYGYEMRKYASLCGLTIDSRLKAATTKTTQKQEELQERFGGI